jgi:hypothetical protein
MQEKEAGTDKGKRLFLDESDALEGGIGSQGLYNTDKRYLTKMQ